MICVIPARGGSKRIPRKNIKPLLGPPIIYYPIAAALESGLFSTVYVSTEDAEIADVADMFGAKVLLRRPELAEDDVPDIDVVKHVAGFLRQRKLCWLYPTAALVTPEQLTRGYELFNETGQNVRCRTSAEVRDVGQFYFYDMRKIGRDISWWTWLVLREDECQDVNTPEDWALLSGKLIERSR